MRKIRYLASYRTKEGRTVYRFPPSDKKMRDAGFCSETLGEDLNAAIAKVEQYNAEWDALRNADKGVSHRKDVAWLIHQFERDKDWYLDKAKSTREEIDYAFKIFGNIYGQVPAIAIRRKHCRDLYNELRDDGSPPQGHEHNEVGP